MTPRGETPRPEPRRRFLQGRTAILALFLLLLPGGAVAIHPADLHGQSAKGTLLGRVFGRHGSVVGYLPSAMLELEAAENPGRYRTTTTDSLGSYAVRDLPPGTWRVKVLHVGYESIASTVRVPPGSTVELDLELRWKPIALPPLRILGDPLLTEMGAEARPSERDLGEVALRALEASPGMVEAGLADVVRSLPGHDPADPTDVILMRGSATDLKLVLLDGAPIYTPFHMAGLVESFDPLALGGASLFLGGAPARFDGGLSYILDLRSRSPRKDRLHGSTSVDLMTGSILLEGPLAPGTGFLLGSRTIHDLGVPLLGRGTSPYGYGDVLARAEWEGDGTRGAYVTGFWNRESVALDLSSDAAEDLASSDGGGLGSVFGGPGPGEGAFWGNQALTGGVWGTVDDTRIEIRGALSRYDAELPVGDTLPLFARSRSDRARLTADVATPWGEGFLRLGASLDRQESRYSSVTLDSTRAGRTTRFQVDGITGGIYAEGGRPLSPALTLRGGLRLDGFSDHEGIRVAPRMALAWALTDRAVLTVAGGRYHQFSTLTSAEVQESLAPPEEGSGGPPGLPIEMEVASANHLVVSLDQVLTPALRLGLEGFMKDFSGIAGSPEEDLNASGVDIRVAREGDGASGWLGYTLTWFWASDGILASGASPFSGRHLLSAGLNARLSERTGLRLRASYGDGLPYTAIPLSREDAGIPLTGETAVPTLSAMSDNVLNAAPELTAGPDEGFLRVEAEAFGRWTPTLGGRPLELRPYVRVLNALNRRDALFYHFEPWRDPDPKPLAELSILPLVGLEMRF